MCYAITTIPLTRALTLSGQYALSGLTQEPALRGSLCELQPPVLQRGAYRMRSHLQIGAIRSRTLGPSTGAFFSGWPHLYWVMALNGYGCEYHSLTLEGVKSFGSNYLANCETFVSLSFSFSPLAQRPPNGPHTADT